MEDPLYKNSSAESQNESVNLSVDGEGLFNSTTVFPLKDISSENKGNLEIMIKNESNEEINGYIDISCMTSTNCKSLQLSELAKQKTCSPTLIESAIKVMKNLFSPEKVISKSASVISSNNNSRSASGSSCVSTSFPGKADVFAMEPENEIHNIVQPAPGENSFKSHSQNNELEMLQTPLTLDPHNNTDESFMTTVSLIDDSFHSAVTNLDEYGEFVRNSANLKDNILNRSRDSDLIDPSNDTLENNDSCLENTTLKIDNFSHDEIKLPSFSVQNKDEFIKNLSSTQTNKEISDLDDFGKVSVIQVQCSNCSIQSEKNWNSEVSGISTEISLKEEAIRDAVFQENFKKVTLPSEIIPKIKNTVKDIEMADIYLNESFTEQVPSEQNKIFSNGFDQSLQTETIEKLNIEETDKQKEIYVESLNNEDNFVDNCISTTTIVLNTGESVDLESMLLSLKTDDSSTNISTLAFEGDDVTCSLDNEILQSDAQCRRTTNLFLLTQQRYCVSEGNSPNRSESTKTKLNKSDELLNRKMFSEPFEKYLNSDKSSVDYSLIKKSEASKMSNKSDNVKCLQYFKQPNGSKNNESKVDSPLNKTDPVAVISQQSYTILTVQDTNLNRPVIEPLNISSDLSRQEAPQTNDSDPMISTESVAIEECFVNNNSSGSFITEDLVKSPQVKQSTPLWEGNNETNTFFRPTTLKLHSPELPESACGNTKLIEKIGDSDFLSNKAKQIFSINESSEGISPVNPGDDRVEDEAGKNHQDRMISTSKKLNKIYPSPDVKLPSKESPEYTNDTVIGKLNQTFDKKEQHLGSEDQFSHEKSESHATHPLNQTFEKEVKSPDANSKSSQTPKHGKLNVTFDINSNSRSPNSNKTFTKQTTSPEIREANITFDKSESPEPALLNKTYDKPINNHLNQTFSKETGSPGPQKLNETFDKKSESPVPGKMIQISDGILESLIQNETNQTFVLDSYPKDLDKKLVQESNQIIKTVDIKESDMFGVHLESVSKDDNTFSKGSKICDKKTEAFKTSQEPTLSEGQTRLSSSFPATAVLDYGSNSHTECFGNNDANDSFVSTKSSNASLFCSDISTVVFNEEDCPGNRSIDDLSGKLGKMDLNENTIKDSELSFPVCVSLPEGSSCFREAVEEQNLQTEDNFLSPLKDDKLRCDPDLVQLIREQFSSNDIEKICSVVQDLSSVKLTNDILKASEQFDKSFHGNSSGVESKLPEIESNKEKTINALSPQSFDFLNSIGGKPTGRDLSRESLYVKFDPLVQPPANSLIDFTKEGEALAGIDSSPVNAHSSSICEQLLTISPQKKPDAIVPPLTPLSHKLKANSNEDKLERLKELQNEIYFLKNLYAERERSNKAKMEEYENQIAKLTGENCMLEEKLKESNEREKSLVKKMKEQTQSIGQLKIIMEEYVNVISKLSSELETIKNENFRQLETLSLEKDSYMTHLQNTEAAFTDVHAKYEKSKKTIVSLKANEILYRNTIAEQAQKMEEFKTKAREAQEKALVGFQKIQEELNQTKASHSQEAARLKAQLRKTELKVEALQESLDQKIKENQQLTAICDELIEGKK